MFNAPAPGGEVLPPRDLVGQLLIIRPTSVEQVQTQSFGEKEAVRVDVAVLTMQNLDGSYGVVHRDVLWFSGRIIGSLKRQLGELVLARMAQGTGKPGQQPPFELDDATGDAQAVSFAEQWMGAHPEFRTAMSAPKAAPATQPAAAPVPAAVPIPGAAPVAAAVPQAAVPQAAAVPAAVAALPEAAPVQQAAVPAAPAAAAGIDPAVLAQLGPDALRQLAAVAQQMSTSA